jgi:hypothetical protein
MAFIIFILVAWGDWEGEWLIFFTAEPRRRGVIDLFSFVELALGSV